jgi:hypothetical protein
MHRRNLNGALHNFLATFTSRYSDYDGYWLFGFLLDDTDELKIDLLNSGSELPASSPLQFAANIARHRFREQLAKAGLNMSCAREAYVTITKLPETRRGLVNGHASNGHEVRCIATVITDLGKTYQGRMNIFVAPHNPEVEQRRARLVPQTGRSN